MVVTVFFMQTSLQEAEERYPESIPSSSSLMIGAESSATYPTGGTGVSPVQDWQDAGPTESELERLFSRSTLHLFLNPPTRVQKKEESLVAVWPW